MQAHQGKMRKVEEATSRAPGRRPRGADESAHPQVREIDRRTERLPNGSGLCVRASIQFGELRNTERRARESRRSRWTVTVDRASVSPYSIV